MTATSKREASARRRAKNRERGEKRAYPRVRARPILRGVRVKITRRCLEQRMFLATGEDPEAITNFFGYALGLALQEYGLQFHGACQMSNHYHLDVTDVRAERVKFKNAFHADLARGLNARRGRTDHFWEAGGPCDTCQPSDDQTIEDIVYTEVNPVKAGLVKWAHRWPGFTSHGWKFGETRTFKRPHWFFDPENPDRPPEVHITRVRPDVFRELSDDELYDLLMNRVREREVEKQAEMRKENRRFKGEKKLSREHWNTAPTARKDRFTVKPKVVASNRWRRLAQLQRDRAWEREYAKARDAFRRREPALFPVGTYWLRVHYGVLVAHTASQAPP